MSYHFPSILLFIAMGIAPDTAVTVDSGVGTVSATRVQPSQTEPEEVSDGGRLLFSHCASCPTQVLFCYLMMGRNAHAASNYPGGYYGEPHTHCLVDPVQGPCWGHSVGCLAMRTPEDMDRARRLVADASTGSELAALALTVEFPEMVQAVPERGAILVSSCGSIIGFFPVSTVVLSAIAPTDVRQLVGQ